MEEKHLLSILDKDTFYTQEGKSKDEQDLIEPREGSSMKEGWRQVTADTRLAGLHEKGGERSLESSVVSRLDHRLRE